MPAYPALPIAPRFILSDGAADIARAPDKFARAAVTAAGATTLFTPSAGKSFRLLRYYIEVPSGSAFAIAGTQILTLVDGLTNTVFVHEFTIPATGTQVHHVVNLDIGPVGFLSAAPGNALKVNLGTAFSAGAANIIAQLTEE